jgi:hypothetical protein
MSFFSFGANMFANAGAREHKKLKEREQAQWEFVARFSNCV